MFDEKFSNDPVLLGLLEQAFQEVLAGRRSKGTTGSPRLVTENVRSDLHIALGRALASKIKGNDLNTLAKAFSDVGVPARTATELAMRLSGID